MVTLKSGSKGVTKHLEQWSDGVMARPGAKGSDERLVPLIPVWARE